MASEKKNLSHPASQFDGLAQALSSQLIVDVFVVQGIITPSDADKIKSSYKNNLAIERFLLSNKLISREAINKAYSIILKLPFIGLSNYQIKDEVLKILPKKVARKYFVLPFALKNNVLNLAIGSPGDLFFADGKRIEEFLVKNNLKIELFVSTPGDIISILEGEKTTAGIASSVDTYPVIFLRNRNIDIRLLKLLPFDFISKNRLAIFEQKDAKSFRIAVEDPYNPKTKKIVEYIKNQNKIDLEQFSTSLEDINYLLSLYEKVEADQDSNSEEIIEKKPESAHSELGNLFGEQPEFTIDTREKFVQSEEGKKSAPTNEKVETLKREVEQMRQDEEEEKDIGKLIGQEIKTTQEFEKIAEENSIPKLVAAMISYALNLGASDIHIEPESKKVRLRFRIDGVLKDINSLPLEFESQMVSRIKILSGMKLDETRIPQDGRFSVNFENREVDVRVSVLPTVFGEKVVMRILDKTAGILSLEDLGFVGSAFKIILEQLKKPYGVILATGPTGSGKSTTLYAILNRINQPNVNVVTLEDPVEYEIPGVNQCQIKPKFGFTFADGLRSILRQDPNIIMVGEVRDADTAGMVTHAALTGHLVLTTLHTNDAASALPRLINMGVEPFLITSSINLIIAQRLVRRICVKCREKVDIPPALTESIEKELQLISENNKEDFSRIKKVQFQKGRGCPECSDGYRGRVGIYELLVMNDEIERMAVALRPASEIKLSAVKSGMLTMRQDGILKALSGLTTIDEILLATGEIGVGEAAILAENREQKDQNLDKKAEINKNIELK